MIQRIQTIYFFLAATALGLLFAFPLGTVGQTLNFIGHHPIALTSSILGIVFSLIALCFFKNRKFQRKLALLAIFSTAIVIGSLVYILVFNPTSRVETFGFGTLLPILALIFLLLAIKGINKDDALISSMDRLR